jgi:acetolactate synthase-1/2/3 large subunit
MQTVADALARGLVEAGIDTVFGLPGGETVEILDAIRRKGLRFVLTHRESSAVFMASAAARLSGRIAACLTTLGPGATNAVTGVGHAYLDRAPVIVISAQTPDRLIPHHTHQVVDLEGLFTPITKATIALKARGAVETVRSAIALVRSGRPGPVHLRLANDEAAQSITPGNKSRVPTGSKEVEGLIELQTARQALLQSKQPVIVAGLGLEPERPYKELLGLAEALDAPVIVTPKAKGAISDEHPLSAGTVGLTRTDPVYEVLDEADLILAVGFDVVELVKPWKHLAPLVWVASWPNLGPSLPATAELVGPMKPVLSRLAEIHRSKKTDWGAKRVLEHRQKYRPLSAPPSETDAMTPQAVLRVIRDNLPAEAVVSVDVGSHKILSCLEWPAFTPNCFLVSNGLSSMGYALPAAIAASLVRAQDPVVCLTGDAGLVMNMGELNTLARLKAPVAVVVFKDNALDLIRSHQNRAGKPTFGTEFAAPDFKGIAEAHGIRAHRVSNEQALTEAVGRYVESRDSTLIEAEIDPRTYPTTPTQTTS